MVTEALPKTLRDLQAKANVTNSQVAVFCGVSNQTITNWRSGHTKPQCLRFDRLRIILGCTAQELEAALEATKQSRKQAGLEEGGGGDGKAAFGQGSPGHGDG